MEKKIRTALIQYMISADWHENIARVEKLLAQAADMGAELAILPEMFVQPYDMRLIPERAEPVPGGRTCDALSRWAARFGMAIVGGSLSEKGDGGKFYNTSTVWDENGNLLGRHRKMHLFDVNLPGGVSVRESSVLSPGNDVTVVDVLGMKLGVAVCYDVRFPELFRLMALKGAEMVALPGAFNHVSGPHHWEMLLRNRATENTCYVAGVSGISPPNAGYNAWGHSMLVDPFAEVLFDMGKSEGVLTGVIDPERLQDIRSRLPVLDQRRDDLYELKTV